MANPHGRIPLPDLVTRPQSPQRSITTGPLRPASGGHSLLGVDPDLGRLLSPERYERASAEIRVRVVRRAPGPWVINSAASRSDAHHLGLLLLDGVLAADVKLEDVVSSELLGAGDVLRPWPADDATRLLGDEAEWLGLTECRLAVLDQRCAVALADYPEIHAVLLERMDQRTRRLARAQAITSLNPVGRRLRATPWQPPAGGGRMTADGVLLPLDIPHRLPAQLVGARRPTVPAGVGHLVREGALHRRADGAWVLYGEPTGMPHAGTQSTLSRRRLRVEERAVAAPPPAARGDELEFRLRRLRREAEALHQELAREGRPAASGVG